MAELKSALTPKVTFHYQIIRADGTVETGEGDAEVTPEMMQAIEQAIATHEEQLLFDELDPPAHD